MTNKIRKQFSGKNPNKGIIPFFIIVFNILVIMFPQPIVEAARNGVILWLNNVLPALLPFVFGVNILLGLGVINFFGRVLSPAMKRLFNVPGAGGFAVAVGFTSGYPMGAKVVSDLRLQKKITKVEAERLISFCNNSGPLFVLGAVGTGMFGNVRIGQFLLVVHYISAIITGILFKYYKTEDVIRESNTNHNNSISSVSNFGKLFTESVVQSIQTMLIIGGFIIIFSVILELIKIMGLHYYLGNTFDGLIDPYILHGTIFGIIEVTNGVNYLATQTQGGISSILAAASVISFGGLSIHGQSLSFISKTDISVKIYFLGKIIHSAIALCIGWGLYSLFFH